MHDRIFHRISILPYVWNIKRIRSAFSSFILSKLWIFNNGRPGLCQHRPKYPLKHYFKDPKLLKMKWKTTYIYLGFLIPNIVWQILKHFCSTNKFSTRSKFLKRGRTRKYKYYMYEKKIWILNIQWTFVFQISYEICQQRFIIQYHKLSSIIT